MKRYSTRSAYTRDPRALRTRRRASRACLFIAALLVVGAPGCALFGPSDLEVERNRLAAEKVALAERVRLLGLASESLDEQIVDLKAEREDLLERQSTLEAELSARTSSEAALGAQLRAREEELTATASALISESRKVSELTTTYDALVGDLESELAAGEIRVEQLRDGLQVDVAHDILFASGQASLSDAGAAVLVTVAKRLAGLPYLVSVEGHTDSVPISGSLKARYPSNWELAGARASSVVRLFLENGFDGEKLAAVSHGPYQPIVEDDSPAGRARNRRIEIRLRPDADAERAAAEQP